MDDAAAAAADVLYSSLKVDAKADKVLPTAAGDLASIDAAGQYQDSGYKVDDAAAAAADVLYSSLKVDAKADKVLPTAAGDLASIDAAGQYQDSGYKVDDAGSSDATVLWSSLKIEARAEKTIPTLNGNLALIDGFGQYQDSGYRVNDAASSSSTVLWTSQKINSIYNTISGFRSTGSSISNGNLGVRIQTTPSFGIYFATLSGTLTGYLVAQSTLTSAATVGAIIQPSLSLTTTYTNPGSIAFPSTTGNSIRFQIYDRINLVAYNVLVTRGASSVDFLSITVL